MTLRVVTIGDGAMATVCSEIVAGKSTPERPIEVRVWGRDGERLDEINRERENRRYLPGMRISGNVRFTADAAALFAEGPVGLIIAAVPVQYMREALERVKAQTPAEVPVVSVAKGIEIATLKRPSEIIMEVLGPRPVGALSGPSIAGELAKKLPATMVVAAGEAQNTKHKTQSGDGEFSRWVQELFTTPYLRVYRNDDLLGVELAGALKNVIAIAAGILDGLQGGNNAKAALLTRGLVEISRMGEAMGALPETFAGLAGMGDLVTTCVSPEGRNRTFGERVGRGERVENILKEMVGVVEGMPTCESVVRLARGRGISMPICEGLHAVLFEGRNPREEIAVLMARELKSE